MQDDSDKPQQIEKTVGRDVREGNQQQKQANDPNPREDEQQEARRATTGEGLARSGGTPGKQKTTGAHYAGGTKITSEEQGKADAHGAAGASGPPGSAHDKPENFKP